MSSSGNDRVALWARPLGPVSAVVLVGGESRRMGLPKQMLNLGGKTLVEIAVAATEGLVDEVVLAGSGPVPASLEDLKRISDPQGLNGPVAGLVAAMRLKPGHAWVAIACDMPRVRRQAVAWLLGHRKPGVRAVLPETEGGRVEPLLAVYEPTIRDELERRVERGRFGLRYVAESSGVCSPNPPDELRDAWMNVNTMEEFERSVVIDV